MMHKTPEEIDRMRKQFFNDRAEGWMDMWYKDEKTGEYTLHHKDFERLFSIVPLKPGDHVLDAGCGSGALVPWILSKITETGLLHELDFSEKMIEVNKKLHREENIRFLVADAANIPLEAESCDAVICFSCFPHFNDKEGTLREIARVLKRKGRLAVAHFSSSDEIRHHHASCHAVMHDNLPDESVMRELFRLTSLSIQEFIDVSGFYLILADKCP
jgi:demethylmenaquinone methyltransferase/2-methoxy-6-polyprenyl-1,4-benzoquinol methylase